LLAGFCGGERRRIRQLEWDHATFGVVPFEQVVGAIMSESAIPKFGMMPWGKEVIPLQPTPMPIVYFDGVPALSHLNGIIGITLTVTGGVPTADEGVTNCAAVVAFLKCNIPAAVALKGAIESALLLAAPVEKPEGKAN
jgi:hypothetical protein